MLPRILLFERLACQDIVVSLIIYCISSLDSSRRRTRDTLGSQASSIYLFKISGCSFLRGFTTRQEDGNRSRENKKQRRVSKNIESMKEPKRDLSLQNAIFSFTHVTLSPFPCNHECVRRGRSGDTNTRNP